MPPKDVAWPSLLQGHIAATGLSCPPGPQGCSQHSCFTVSQPLVCAGGMGLFPVMVQGFVLPPAELPEVPASPLLPLVEVPLDGSLPIWSTSSSP